MVRSKVGTGVLALAVTLPAVPVGAEEATRVVYSGGRLTVHARGVPLTEIVTEIGRQSHAEIVGAVSKPRDVNQDVEAAPLVDALGRLLVDQNFTLRYGPGGELRTIRLMGEAVSTKPSPPPVAGSPETASNNQPPAPRHESRAMRASRQALPDGSLLVSVRGAHDATVTTHAKGKGKRHDGSDDAPEVPAVVGGVSTQSATPAQPQSAATSQDQPQVDAQPTPDELQRRLRRSFLDALTQMDDATLAQYLGTPEGQHIEALLQYYAAHRPSSTANQKANGILGRIPDSTSGPSRRR